MGLVVAGLWLAAGALPVPGQERTPAPGLLLKVDKKAWSYTAEQLRAMATVDFKTFRGTKRNPAVPLEGLLTRDTGLRLERVRAVVVIGETKVLVIEGERLKYLKDLVIKLGPNQLALAPETEEAAEALKPLWGKPRIEGVERVQVLLGQ